MSVTQEEAQVDGTLVLDYELDASPEKVWRAISIPALRERWLPSVDLAGAGPVSAIEGREISFRLRDEAPPYRESLVTFSVSANRVGGARLRIVQRPAGSDALRPEMRASNANLAGRRHMLAA